ncbi:MAG: thiamine biosynthesis protein ThiS [Acidobacteria bacterium 13_1_40CM_2_68_5]|nr:MAG: thiamine biosynthesis protein ThiS [Acidobacteria bacterium 13_1_40CM_2_68_5]OLE66580.1 MAG: thiamine biosynthesis protein ThiS [Acidobacteria bacterium 13_1_20CM_2_68_7]
MTIVLNGETRGVPVGATVLALLEAIGIAPGRVAVEVNGRVVRRDDYLRLALRDNDRVEVVHLVGGG